VAGQHDAPEVLERFNANLDLVGAIARQVGRAVGRATELEELLSFGREGLLDAARRYDAARGVPFRGYASFRVRGAMIDGVRSLARLPRRAHERLRGLEAATRVSEGAYEDLCASGTSAQEQAEQALAEHLAAMATAAALGFVATTARGDEGELLNVAPDDDPEEAALKAQLAGAVRTAIESLPAEEAALVRRHYLNGERFDRVAEDLGLSKSWASRLHTRAIGRLSKRLRRDFE
jgi:RNA polymerase sigma factor for flagellar operon FliA